VRSGFGPPRQRITNVDEVIGDHAKADPPLHAVSALVSAAGEAMAALDDADTPLASGPPLLAMGTPL
jgi:hypothetical protein